METAVAAEAVIRVGEKLPPMLLALSFVFSRLLKFAAGNKFPARERPCTFHVPEAPFTSSSVTPERVFVVTKAPVPVAVVAAACVAAGELEARAFGAVMGSALPPFTIPVPASPLM